MALTYTNIKSCVNEAIDGLEGISSQEKNNLKTGYADHMSFYGMTDGSAVNNKNMIIFLSNFLNYLTTYYHVRYKLNASFDYDNVISAIRDTFKNWLEENKGKEIDTGIGSWKKVLTEKQAEKYYNKMMGSWFSDDKIKSCIFLPKDYDIEMKIDTVIEYNGAPLNSQYKIPFDANSELSDGTITTADVQKLMENIVYSRIMDNHVQFYGTVSDLSAICSSSSSSSSCDFIAYMKLA